MALTATASKTLRMKVMKTLGMTNASVVSMSPDKRNIRYIVKRFSTLEECFGPLASELVHKQNHMDKVLILCRTIDDCSTLILNESYLQLEVSRSLEVPLTSPSTEG